MSELANPYKESSYKSYKEEQDQTAGETSAFNNYDHDGPDLDHKRIISVENTSDHTYDVDSIEIEREEEQYDCSQGQEVVQEVSKGPQDPIQLNIVQRKLDPNVTDAAREVEAVNCIDTESFHKQIISKIKFSPNESKTAFKIWLILTIVIGIMDMSLQIARGVFFISHTILKGSVLLFYILAIIYFIYNQTGLVVPTVYQTSPQSGGYPDTDLQQGAEDSIIDETKEHGTPIFEASTSTVAIPSASPGPSRKKASLAILGKETVINAMKLSTVVGDTIKTAAEI